MSQDYQQAVYWFTKAAKQGYANAQSMLGLCYYYGEGVSQDYQQAVHWYTLAANQGDATSQKDLGECYLEGKGVKKNCRKALKWFKKAKANGAFGTDWYIEVAKECIKGKK